jgi:hypothetical protein
MRKLAVLFLLFVLFLPALAGKRIDAKPIKIRQVTVRQLDQALADAAARSADPKADQELAAQLASLELTERVSTQRLAQWKLALPGEASARRLVALADSSAFLDLPAEDIPKAPPPDREAQLQAMNAISAYVAQVLQRLPNFFASQSVMMFQEVHGMMSQSGTILDQPLHYAGGMKTNVRYLDNKEVIDSGKRNLTEGDQLSSGLLFSDEFGPVLDTVLGDTQGKFLWGHWEPGASLTLAVFRYSVARHKSHCQIRVLMPGAHLPSQTRPGYHGEIAVDPASGAIYRLTLIADLSPEDPMGAARMAVEYGPVEIGGVTFICPMRSIRQVTVFATDATAPFTLTSSQHLLGMKAPDNPRMQYGTKGDVPSQTLLNDTVYDDYHLLRADVRIIRSDEKPDSSKQP